MGYGFGLPRLAAKKNTAFSGYPNRGALSGIVQPSAQGQSSPLSGAARPDPIPTPSTQGASVGRYDLTRQPNLTEGYGIAEAQNTQGLKTGQFADVQSAQAATDRANSLRTSQALQQTRGTLARSGVDISPAASIWAQDQAFSAAEGQNLNGTNAVNQLQRQYRTDAQAQAQEYESRAQDSANNERTYQTGRDDQQNTNNQWDVTRGDDNSHFNTTSGQAQQVIDNNNTNTAYNQKMDQINAITDPVAKNLAIKAMYEGGDLNSAISGNIGADGQLINHSISPAQIEYQGKIENLKTYNPKKAMDDGNRQETDAEYDARITKMAQDQQSQDQALTRAPLDTATKTANAEQAATRLANGNPKPGDFDTLPSVTTQAIPLGGATNKWLAGSKTNGWTKIGGTPYHVIKGGNTTPGSATGDYAILTDQQGNPKYLLPNGTISDVEPKKKTTYPDRVSAPSPVSSSSNIMYGGY